MGAVLGYVAWQLTHVDLSIFSSLADAIDPTTIDEMRRQFAPYHMSKAELFQSAYVGFFELIFVLTVIYQGGMTIYYARRRARVITALHQIHGHD